MYTATHTSKNGPWLYRVKSPQPARYNWQGGIFTELYMEFWDTYCNKWRNSIVDGRKLVELQRVTSTITRGS